MIKPTIPIGNRPFLIRLVPFRSVSLLSLRLCARLLLVLVCAAGLACQKKSGDASNQKVLRVGHFPNLTHAQALVARQMAAEGKDWFGERLGPEVELQWLLYNAGPSAVEGIFAGSVDLTYIGPSPVLNGYNRARGEDVRVISGAAMGGAALVAKKGGRIQKPEDFRGGRIATPQLGNTQDVAARAWLKKHGFAVTQLGGDVHVLPAANPDQLSLFAQDRVDGVWTVEPWVSRLELDANGSIFFEETDAVTTVLAASAASLEHKRPVVVQFVKAHQELTEWINANPEDAKRLVRAALKDLTRRELPATLADRAWPRLKFSAEVRSGDFQRLVEDAQGAGFLKEITPLDRLVVPLP